VRAGPQRGPVADPVDVAIVETAKSYPTDGYRMVCCFVRRKLGVAVNRKHAVDEQAILPGTLTLGTDNGSAFTARSTRLAISALGLTHRRGGYRDPESQAFIESWLRYLKERCVWRNAFETLDQAREVIAAYIDHYHDRPPQPTRLQDAARSARNVGRCDSTTTKTRGLNRQHGEGAVHLASVHSSQVYRSTLHH